MRVSFSRVFGFLLVWMAFWWAMAPSHAQFVRTQTFSNSDGITISAADGTTTTPYPSLISVSGLGEVTTKVVLKITGFSHTLAMDVRALLMSPTGETSYFLGRLPYNGAPPTNLSITFDEETTNSDYFGEAVFWQNAPWSSGTFKPGYTQIGWGGTWGMSLEFPGITGPQSNRSFNVFNGKNPNGQWKLYLSDPYNENGGGITGWELQITSRPAFDVTRLIVNTVNPADPNDGKVSLSEAIEAAGTEPGAHTVSFDPAVFNTPQTIDLNSELWFSDDSPLTIQGPGADKLLIRSSNPAQYNGLLRVRCDDLTISGITFADTQTSDSAAIALTGFSGTGSATFSDCVFKNLKTTGTQNFAPLTNFGSHLTLRGCTFSDNSSNGNGGAVGVFPGAFDVTVEVCTFQNNTAPSGGAIYKSGAGKLTLRGSSFSSNTAGDKGGAVHLSGAADLTIEGCTFSDHTAQTTGGAVFGDGLSSFLVANSTFKSNKVQSAGQSNAGLAVRLQNVSGARRLVNCTFAFNGSGPGACAFATTSPIYTKTAFDLQNNLFVSNDFDLELGNLGLPGVSLSAVGNNISTNTEYWMTAQSGNLSGQTPAQIGLGTLQDNGGPVKTMAIGNGSVALDAGMDSTGAPYNLTTDARGVGFARKKYNAPDVGAFEAQTTPPVFDDTALPLAYTGKSYSQTLQATDRDGDALSWNWVSGDLPPGLTLSSAGVLSGVPSEAGGNQTFTFRVSVSDGTSSDEGNVTLFVRAPGRFVVTTDQDTTDAGDGETSLREAVAAANASLGPDVVSFDADFFGNTSRVISLHSGAIQISDSLVIEGTKRSLLRVDGADLGRVFFSTSGDLTVRDLTISDARGFRESGGGLGMSRTSGADTLTVERVEFRDNAANLGGGIYARGVHVRILDSHFKANTGGTRDGGGLALENPLSAQISGTVFENNTATYGGALAVREAPIALSDGGVKLFNCTFTGNSSDYEPTNAILARQAALSLTHCTFSPVGTPQDIETLNDLYLSAQVRVWAQNSILGQVETSGNIAPPRVSGGGNIAPLITDWLDQTSDQSGLTDAQIGLQPLADNGGASMTMALDENSVARNAGVSTSLTTDARGAGFSRVRDGAPDAGAFEATAILRAPSFRLLGANTNGAISISGSLPTQNAEGTALSYSFEWCHIPSGAGSGTVIPGENAATLDLSQTSLNAIRKGHTVSLQITVSDGTQSKSATQTTIVTNAVPRVVAPSPLLGISTPSHTLQPVTVTIEDADGANDIRDAWLHINESSSWRSAIFAFVIPSAQTLYLFDDSRQRMQSVVLPLNGARVSLENASQGRVWLGRGDIVKSGDQMRVTFQVERLDSQTPPTLVRGAGNDNNFAPAGRLNTPGPLVTLGKWQLPNRAPLVVPPVPLSQIQTGAGEFAEIEVEAEDENGADDVQEVWLHINSSASWSGAILARLNLTRRYLSLRNAANTGGDTVILPRDGSRATLSNSLGTVSVGLNDVVKSGNRLKVRFRVARGGGEQARMVISAGVKDQMLAPDGVAGYPKIRVGIGTWTLNSRLMPTLKSMRTAGSSGHS